jgi:hypothetical protein
MDTALSPNEREALSRFLLKVIEDVDKLAVLFELRGADSTLTRAAQENLRATLAALQDGSEAEMSTVRVFIPTSY